VLGIRRRHFQRHDCIRSLGRKLDCKSSFSQCLFKQHMQERFVLNDEHQNLSVHDGRPKPGSKLGTSLTSQLLNWFAHFEEYLEKGHSVVGRRKSAEESTGS